MNTIIIFLRQNLGFLILDLSARSYGVVLQYLGNLLPDLFVFNIFRLLALKFSGAKFSISGRVVCRRGVFVEYPKNLRLGDRVQINRNVYLGTNGIINIGDGTRVAMSAQFVTVMHDGDRYQNDRIKEINIGKYCHIGMGACILPGSKLHDHVIVAPGAVFSGVGKPGGVYAGNPAICIAMRDY